MMLYARVYMSFFFLYIPIQNMSTFATVAIAVVVAAVYYNYKKGQAQTPEQQPTIESVLYVFVATFGLVWLAIYAMKDSAHHQAMNEIEVGEPDF
jgi:heme/copper-type cytochrome/quinol oxidase subunit 2